MKSLDPMIHAFADAKDLSAVRGLLAANGLPREDVSDHLRNFLTVRSSGRLVAIVGLEIHGHLGLLRSLCVAEDSRRRGIATDLCEQIEDLARGSGVDGLYLLTTTAREFFARRGFAVVARETVPPVIQETAEFRSLCPSDATCMMKRLSADARGRTR